MSGALTCTPNAAIDTYDDHRIAMCFSLACLGGVPLALLLTQWLLPVLLEKWPLEKK